MSSPNEYKARQDASIQKAKACLADKKDDKAVAYFKRACIYCDCNKASLQSFFAAMGSTSDVDVPLPSCLCRDILSLDPEDDDKQAILKLVTKTCTCGSGVKSCHVPAHLEGLNGMAAICARRKAFKDAYHYASLLILVAPQDSKGYLRLAKSMRLQDASEGTDCRKRWEWIYSQLRGIDPASLNGLVSVFRVDIVSNLPPEIQEMILSWLSFRDLCRCMRVSKAWKYAARNQGLWRNLEFVKLWPTSQTRPLTKAVLNDIICRRSRNMAQSLVISGLEDFRIDESRLAPVLKALPRLRSLTLHKMAPHMAGRRKEQGFNLDSLLDTLCSNASKRLQTLHFENFTPNPPFVPIQGEEFRSSINFAPSLRELKIGGVYAPGFFQAMTSTEWPNLEKVHFQNLPSYPPKLLLNALMTSSPSLKDLTFEDTQAPGFGFLQATRGQPHNNNLERLRLCCAALPPLGGFLPQCQALRSLELESDRIGQAVCYDLFLRHFADPDPDAAHPMLKNVEHLRCIDSISLCEGSPEMEKQGLIRLIQASCDNGTLRSLHINFNPGLYDPYINKKVIHTLACHDIKVPSIHQGGQPGQTDALLDWLDEFPALTTLGIFPENADNAWLIVAKVVRKLDEATSLIKTIYTNALKGVYRDEILEMAAKKGITMIHADRVPEPKLLPLPSP